MVDTGAIGHGDDRQPGPAFGHGIHQTRDPARFRIVMRKDDALTRHVRCQFEGIVIDFGVVPHFEHGTGELRPVARIDVDDVNDAALFHVRDDAPENCVSAIKDDSETEGMIALTT